MTQIMSRTLTAHSLIGTRDGINSDTRTFHFIWLQNHLSIYIFKFVSMQDRLGVKVNNSSVKVCIKIHYINSIDMLM